MKRTKPKQTLLPFTRADKVENRLIHQAADKVPVRLRKRRLGRPTNEEKMREAQRRLRRELSAGHSDSRSVSSGGSELAGDDAHHAKLLIRRAHNVRPTLQAKTAVHVTIRCALVTFARTKSSTHLCRT